MGKKKKFIDKKNAITFSLVHRSQKDPLVADETAPKHVLLPLNERRQDEQNEQAKYGIYLDDGYDYLQHLKEIDRDEVELVRHDYVKKERAVKDNVNLRLPSSVFASEIEGKIGLLGQGAPKGLELRYNDEILEAYAELDEPDSNPDSENEFEDDFIALGGGALPTELGKLPESDEEYEYDDDEEISDEERRDEIFELEERKSRFTNYSMSSSVIRRNEQLSFLDDRFEEMFAQYDDEEIGALDTEEIEGAIDPKSSILTQIADEYENDNKPVPFDTSRYKFVYEESSGDESDCSLVEIKEKEKWDCESILSTYSNLYNHPKLIGAPPSNKIKINSKTGIPVTSNRLTASALAKHDGEPKSKATGPGSLVSMVSILSIRPKNETPDERHSRKKAYKRFKKERRIEKKLNSEAFKEEKKRMEKVMTNNKHTRQVPL